MNRYWKIAIICGLLLVISGCTQKWFTSEKRDHALSSNNIVMNSAGTLGYIANLDVPTVTIWDVKKNKVIKEIYVGKNPSTLTLSPDEETLYVACSGDNSVQVIDLAQKEVVQKIKVGIEPYGVLISSDGSKLYVSNFRSNQLSVVDTGTGAILNELPLDEKPRSMAITADGKELYVLHYLSGKISFIDLEKEKVVKKITLALSSNKEDRKKSQGIPNALEQITIAPNGKEAWVSHLVTNVDTPIHFEETIFPAISCIDLVKKEEVKADRKELFKEIDVKDSQNKTMIVSNPIDIVFSPKMEKAYVLMSGSEDLVVFDLKRGNNATQILRHVPGNFPVGMDMSKNGKQLFIHNGMSHDLVRINTGYGVEYSEATVQGENLPLIEKDPLPPLVRKGKKLFYSANSSENATNITKDNWMSCASCHAGGETNGLTLMTPKGPRNVPSNVLAMKTGRFLWDGSRDDFTDYLLTVQTEMGGMLHLDPSKPLPADIKKMYQALAAYLDTIPVPQNPNKAPHGNLTSKQKLGKQLFKGKANCISCHAGPYLTNSAQAKDEKGKLTAVTTDYLFDVGTENPLDKYSDGDARAGMKNPRNTTHFDVPTLKGVFTTAPYLHDGSAKTILDVLTTRNKKGLHGDVGDLNKKELDALVEYVKSIE